MSESSYSIIWQKWYDPFGLDDNFEFEKENSEEFSNFVEDAEEIAEQEINQEKIKNYLNNHKFKGRIKVISTPMGIIPLNDNTASNKIFNFWIGHTNFDITHHIGRVIEDTEGVETLDIFTRYRFRISVGKAFDDAIVMRKINNRVYMELSNVKS